MSRQFSHLGDAEAFLITAEQGSMSAAAIALSTTPSVISRAISRLEIRLGAQLLRRTTRHSSLTDAGRLYLQQLREAFDLIENVERDLQGDPGGELVGSVRMSVPTTYGNYRLPCLLAPFVLSHPKVKIDISISNRNVDLVAEGFDVAIRMGALRDSALSARLLENASLKMVASPAYLSRMGVPKNLGDLARHMLLPFVMPSTGRHGPWLLYEKGEQRSWVPEGNIQVMDDVIGCVSLALAGIGICQTYDFILENHITDGKLVEILPSLNGGTRPFSLLFPSHRNLSPATRRLIDTLSAASHTLPVVP